MKPTLLTPILSLNCRLDVTNIFRYICRGKNKNITLKQTELKNIRASFIYRTFFAMHYN